MELIPIPDWSENDRAKFFDTTMKDALSVGLTSIHDADSSPEQIAFFKKYPFRNPCIAPLLISLIIS